MLYNPGKYDQKWHFYIAYYAQREFYSQPECPVERKKMLLTPLKADSNPLTDLKRLKNIELVMWLCKVAGVNSPTCAKYTVNPANNPECIDRSDMQILAEEIINSVKCTV